MSFDIKIKELPPEKIMYNRVETNLDKAMVDIPKAFKELYAYLIKAGAKLSGKG